MRLHAVVPFRVHGLVGAPRSGLALARGVGLEPLVSRDAAVALGLRGLVGVLGIGQALRFGRALVSSFFVNAALALLFSSGVDAARVALAFCVDETS